MLPRATQSLGTARNYGRAWLHSVSGMAAGTPELQTMHDQGHGLGRVGQRQADATAVLQAGKTIDSFFDLLAGRNTYTINGVSLPLQARACS